MAKTLAEGTLRACMSARVPVVLVGPPGVGKSAVLRGLAEEINYELITLVGSQMDPTDMLGLPKGEKIPLPDGSEVYATVNLAPSWQVQILKKRRVVLFLEEISNSSPATRASMLVMLQDREFPNGEKMPPETIIVGAMNPKSQAADGYGLDLPTSNRLCFIPWSANSDAWISGMLSGWGQEISKEEQDAKTLIAEFIRDNPAKLLVIPAPGKRGVNTAEVFGIDRNDDSKLEVFEYTWPSPRSWDKLSQAWPHAKGNEGIEDSLAQGIVGFSAAADFREWLKRHSRISPIDVLADPNSVKWRSVGHDQVTMTLRAIVELAKDPKHTAAAVNVFEHIADIGAAALGGSYIQDLIRVVMTAEIPGMDKKAKQRMAADLAGKYRSVAAGMS